MLTESQMSRGDEAKRQPSTLSIPWQMCVAPSSRVRQWAWEQHPPYSLEDHLPLVGLLCIIATVVRETEKWWERRETKAGYKLVTHMEAAYLLWLIDQGTQWIQVSGSENGSTHMRITWNFVSGLEGRKDEVRDATVKETKSWSVS